MIDALIDRLFRRERHTGGHPVPTEQPRLPIDHPGVDAEREALRQRRERHVLVARDADEQWGRLHVATAHLRSWGIMDQEANGD